MGSALARSAVRVFAATLVVIGVFVACLSTMLSMTPARYAVTEGVVKSVIGEHKATVSYGVGKDSLTAYMFFDRPKGTGDQVDVAYMKRDPTQYHHPRVNRVVLLAVAVPVSIVAILIGLFLF